MTVRTLSILTALVLASSTARADVAIGGFVGEPTGLDVKLGLADHSALDLLFGSTIYHEFGGALYGHLTYLVTPVVSHGESVLVPLRVGIGVAVFDNSSTVDRWDVGARFPVELALRFRSAPLELYGELALLLTFINPADNRPFADIQGGIGIRFYF